MATRRQQNRFEQRARITEAARKLFSKHGIEDVTMADVAAEAGVSRTTVFNHFRSKHALLEAITEDVLDYYRTMLENALAAEEVPVPALIRTLFSLMGLGIEEDRRFYRRVFREIARIQVGLDEGEMGERARRGLTERLVRLLERGQERGELGRAHRAGDLASAFVSLVNGTITHWLYDDASESLQLSMQRAAEIFLQPVAEASVRNPRDVPDLRPPRRRRKRRAA